MQHGIPFPVNVHFHGSGSACGRILCPGMAVGKAFILVTCGYGCRCYLCIRGAFSADNDICCSVRIIPIQGLPMDYNLVRGVCPCCPVRGIRFVSRRAFGNRNAYLFCRTIAPCPAGKNIACPSWVIQRKGCRLHVICGWVSSRHRAAV